MRVIVIGNGLAGTLFSRKLRELDPKAEIQIFADEKYLYYPRPNLIDYIAGSRPIERMFGFPEEWYGQQDIRVHLETPVQKIVPEAQEIETEGGAREKYDLLFLANGSCAWIPPIQGKDKAGLFTLRTLDDAQAILDYVSDHPQVVVIGGGLLGLEIARAIKSRGHEVEVVEFFPHLLPRQLDPQGGDLLKAQIEKMGIRIRCGQATEEIMGNGRVQGLRFKDGAQLKAETAIVAAGVRPNVRLAKEAGLDTDKGVIVNDLLQTSDPKIFAAGDNIQHRDRWYGIIPASFEQARVAAHNVLSPDKEYLGTVPSNTLKIVGLYVTSVGLVNPEEGTCEEYRKIDSERAIYKKLVIQDGKAVGAIWMGTKVGASEISRIISQRMDVSEHKDSVLEEGFDFSVL